MIFVFSLPIIYTSDEKIVRAKRDVLVLCKATILIELMVIHVLPIMIVLSDDPIHSVAKPQLNGLISDLPIFGHLHQRIAFHELQQELTLIIV